jgi:hypothetical protein
VGRARPSEWLEFWSTRSLSASSTPNKTGASWSAPRASRSAELGGVANLWGLDLVEALKVESILAADRPTPNRAPRRAAPRHTPTLAAPARRPFGRIA